MFTWNTENVLCAIDAGIAEVTRTYNSAHTFALRQGERPWTAHMYALDATKAWLIKVEDDVAFENNAVERMIWGLAQVNPEFVGIPA